MITNIDGKTLQKMFLAGAKNLEAKKEWINELNVFPVPDGDTGTNMTLTIMSAAKQILQWKIWRRQFLPVPYAVPEEIRALYYLSYSGDLPRKSGSLKP